MTFETYFQEIGCWDTFYENKGEKPVYSQLSEIYDNICNDIHNNLLQPNMAHVFHKTYYKIDFLTYDEQLADTVKQIQSHDILCEYRKRFDDEYQLLVNDKSITYTVDKHTVNRHFPYKIPLFFPYNLYLYLFYRNQFVDKQRFYCCFRFEFQTMVPVPDFFCLQCK